MLLFSCRSGVLSSQWAPKIYRCASLAPEGGMAGPTHPCYSTFSLLLFWHWLLTAAVWAQNAVSLYLCCWIFCACVLGILTKTSIDQTQEKDACLLLLTIANQSCTIMWKWSDFQPPPFHRCKSTCHYSHYFAFRNIYFSKYINLWVTIYLVNKLQYLCLSNFFQMICEKIS